MRDMVFKKMCEQAESYPPMHGIILGYQCIDSPDNMSTIMAMAHIVDCKDDTLAPKLCDFIRSNVISNPFSKHEHQ